MTSFRQIETNRVRTQEQRSETEAGKRRSRAKCSSARRTAETVVVALEDTSESTQAFEAAITTLELDLTRPRILLTELGMVIAWCNSGGGQRSPAGSPSRNSGFIHS
jgi:hypothetical protein